tara:strand:- start:935 stop:1099 length:165 start_codon:yes stop_codon:yes gene_type:complete
MKGSIVREFGVFCLLVGGAGAVIGGVLLVWPPLSLIVGGCLAIRLGVQVINSED